MVIMSIVFWDVIQHYIPDSSNIKITAIRMCGKIVECFLVVMVKLLLTDAFYKSFLSVG